MQVSAPRLMMLLCAVAGSAFTLPGCERAGPPPTSGAAANPAVSHTPDGRDGPQTAVHGAAAQSTQAATASAPVSTTGPATGGTSKVVAYYFHRTIRCPTCLSIEKQSREAIELTYGGELRAGTLEWRAVNIEEAGNEHFEQDFELPSQSLVLAEMTGGRVRRWKNLTRVWELVEDPYGFQEYVATEVGAFLAGG